MDYSTLIAVILGGGDFSSLQDDNLFNMHTLFLSRPIFITFFVGNVSISGFRAILHHAKNNCFWLKGGIFLSDIPAPSTTVLTGVSAPFTSLLRDIRRVCIPTDQRVRYDPYKPSLADTVTSGRRRQESGMVRNRVIYV